MSMSKAQLRDHHNKICAKNLMEVEKCKKGGCKFLILASNFYFVKNQVPTKLRGGVKKQAGKSISFFHITSLFKNFQCAELSCET